MSILECRLAAEKEMDGKPFTVCEVDTWFYVAIGMVEEMRETITKENAMQLYDAFGNGKDKTERGITLEELKTLPSNGGIRIIPKTKDKFVRVQDWETLYPADCVRKDKVKGHRTFNIPEVMSTSEIPLFFNNLDEK